MERGGDCEERGVRNMKTPSQTHHRTTETVRLKTRSDVPLPLPSLTTTLLPHRTLSFLSSSPPPLPLPLLPPPLQLGHHRRFLLPQPAQEEEQPQEQQVQEQEQAQQEQAQQEQQETLEEEGRGPADRPGSQGQPLRQELAGWCPLGRATCRP